MTNSKKKKHGSGKAKTFLLFLFLACVIWVLTKFSKEDSASVMAQITYKDLPPNAILAQGNPRSISFDVTGTGYDFLLYKVKPPLIELSVQEYYDTISGRAMVDNAQLVQLIARELDGKQGISNLSTSRLDIRLDLVAEKRVAVRANTNLTFKEGFRPVGEIEIDPDTVTLKGPADLLRELNMAETLVFDKQRLDRAVEEEIKLASDLPQGVSLSPETVKLYLKVEEFTPKQLTLPVVLVNAKEDLEVRLVPEMITLSFDLPISVFNEISDADFKVECDFGKRNLEENFMIPELVEKPEEAVNIEFSHQKIDYLIFKKTN